jgi:hypothetical protein
MVLTIYWQNLSQKMVDMDEPDYSLCFGLRFVRELWTRSCTPLHHEGFCLWQSPEANRDWRRPWNTVDTGPRRERSSGSLTFFP